MTDTVSTKLDLLLTDCLKMNTNLSLQIGDPYFKFYMKCSIFINMANSLRSATYKIYNE